MEMRSHKIRTSDILTEDSLHNAMVAHAAFGGSTNLLLHIPAIAHAAKLTRPTVDDWTRVNRATPRLMDVMPNGPIGDGTVQVFLAGGVAEVMLHLRDLLLRFVPFFPNIFMTNFIHDYIHGICTSKYRIGDVFSREHNIELWQDWLLLQATRFNA